MFNGSDARLLAGVAHFGLRRFGVPSARLNLLKQEKVSSGITRRQIYLVHSTGERFVLRIYRPAFSGVEALISSKDALVSQAHWLEHLQRDKGLSVPSIVRSEANELVEQIEAPGLDESGAERPRLALMQTHLTGDHIPTHQWNEREVALVGALIGRLHRSAQRYKAPNGFVRPSWDWHHVFGENVNLWRDGGRFYSQAQMETFREASHIVWQDLKRLGSSKKTFGMIHRDLHHGNLLFGEEEVRLLDFDICGWGYYLYDLALPLFAISNIHGVGSERTELLNKLLMEHYKREHRLPRGFHTYLQTFLTMRRVTRVRSVLRDATNKGIDQRPEFLTRAVEELERFVERRKGSGIRPVWRRVNNYRRCPSES